MQTVPMSKGEKEKSPNPNQKEMKEEKHKEIREINKNAVTLKV